MSPSAHESLGSRRPWLAVWGALLTVAVLSAAPSRAQQAQAPGAAAEVSGLGSHSRANSALQLVREGKWVAVRELAESLLREEPRSFQGHFLLGTVLYTAEGNVSLAAYHLRQARVLLEEVHGPRPDEAGPWLWHAMILDNLAEVTHRMARFEEELAVLELRDRLYSPPRPAQRAWPLLRLRRYGEARKAIAEGLTSEDSWQVAQARTSLCNLEWELQDRQAAYRACTEALTERDQDDPVLYSNAAEAARALLKMDESERQLLEATRHFQAPNESNPWLDLVWLYLGQGRTAEAVSAAREMLHWRNRQPPYMDEESGAHVQHASTLLLLVMGRGQEAVRVAERALQQPDRVSGNSAEAVQRAGAAALLARRAHLLAAERALEESSWAEARRALAARLEATQHRLQAWEVGQRAAAALQQERRLLATTRPYMAGGLELPEWLRADMAHVVGPGVVAVALEQSRAAEELPAVSAYFDALAAEVAFLQSRWAQAEQLAEQALQALPRSEVLLQARVAALGAHAAREVGHHARAGVLFQRALELEPGVLRRLGLALPCRLESSGGAVADKARALLKGSPRLVSDSEAPFRLQTQGAEASGSACLMGLHGEQLVCASVAPRAGEDAQGAARRLVAAFHEEAFAPKVDLSQADLRSLDGSTTPGRERSLKKLEGLLETLSGERKGGAILAPAVP